MQIAMKVFISIIQQLNGFHVLAILDFKFILLELDLKRICRRMKMFMVLISWLSLISLFMVSHTNYYLTLSALPPLPYVS